MAKVELEIKLNPQLDKAAMKQQISKIEADVSDIDIGIHIDTTDAANALADVVDAYQELEDAMSDILMVDINTDAGEEALKRLNDAIKNVEDANFNTDDLAKEFAKTKKEVDELATKQKQALAQMKLTGQEGSEAYKKLQAEITDTEAKINEMADAMGDLADVQEPEGFMNFMAKFEALGNLGESLKGFAESGLEMKQAIADVQAATGATNEEMIKLKENAINAFKSGVGESVADAVKIMGYGKNVLGDFLDDTEITKFVKSAQGIANVFDKDVNEVIAGSRTFIAQFGLDGQKAADLVALSMQTGASKMDDVLDTLDEYSQLAVKAGYSAEQMTGLISIGMEKGVRDTDKLLDSVKETQIRLNAGDTTKALEGISGPISKTIQGIVKLGETGAKSIREVTTESAAAIDKAFQSGEITASMRDQLTVAITGTMAEDIGGELWTKIFSTPIDESAIREQAAQAGALVNQSLGPVTFIDKIQKELEAFAATAGSAFAGMAQAGGTALTTVSKVAPGLTLIGQSAGPIKDVAKSILTKLAPSLMAAMTAQGGLNLVMSAMPIIGIIAGLAALAAGIYFLVDALDVSTDEHITNTKAQNDLIKTQVALNQKQRSVVQSNLNMVEAFKKQGEAAQDNNDLMLQLAKAYPGVIDKSKTYKENLSALEAAAKKSGTELKGLDTELTDLANKSIDIKVKLSQLEVKKGLEELEDELYGFEWTDLLLGAPGAADKAIKEATLKPFINGINNAKNDSELQKAAVDMQLAILNSKAYDDEEKQHIIGSIEKMTEAKSKALQEQSRTLDKDYKVFASQGLTENQIIDALSKKYKVSKDEVKGMIKVQQESKDTADKQAKAVETIADKWNKAKTEANNLLGTQVSELAALLAKGKARTQDDNERLRILENEGKANVKNIQIYDASEKAARKRLGLDKEAGKSLLELAKQKYETDNETLNILDSKNDLLFSQMLIEKERDATTVETLANEKDKLGTLIKQKQNALDALEAYRLIEITADGIEVNPNLKVADKQAVDKILIDINKEVQDKEKSIQDIELQIGLDKESLQKSIAEFDKSKIEFQISLGIADESVLFPIYQAQLQKLADEKKRLDAETAADDKDNDTEKLIRITEIGKEEIEIQKAVIDAKEALLERAYNKEKTMLELQNEQISRNAEKQKELWERIFTSVEDSSINAIDLATDAKLDAMSKAQERELDYFAGTEEQKKVLQERFESEKIKLQEDAEQRKLATQQSVAGARFALENEQILKSSEAQKKQLELDLAFEQSKTVKDQAAIARLQNDLDVTNETIKNKGDVIRQGWEIVGQGINDVIGDMFQGNTEGMKVGMKEILSMIVGFIEQLLAAWAWQNVLESTWWKSIAALAPPGAEPAVLAAGMSLTSNLIKALASPFLNAISSWSTGGIFDAPTLALIGDGAKLGGENREILLRDDQLQQVLNMTIEKNNALMASYFNNMIKAIQSQRILGVVEGSNLLLINARAMDEENRRNLG